MSIYIIIMSLYVIISHLSTTCHYLWSETMLEVVRVPALPLADVEHYCKRLEITSRLLVGGVISIVPCYNPGISARYIADGVMQGRHSWGAGGARVVGGRRWPRPSSSSVICFHLVAEVINDQHQLEHHRVRHQVLPFSFRGPVLWIPTGCQEAAHLLKSFSLGQSIFLLCGLECTSRRAGKHLWLRRWTTEILFSNLLLPSEMILRRVCVLKSRSVLN